MLLYRPRRTIGADSTLAYLGEYLSYLFLQIISRFTAHNIEAILEETSTEEDVHEIHLPEDVDQVQELTEDELGDVEVVSPVVFVEIIHNNFSRLLRTLLSRVQRWAVQILNEQRNFVSFPDFPEVMREIAAEGLEEEDEYDPLVPVLRHWLRPPGHTRASSSPPSSGEAVAAIISTVYYEGPVDPTVRIH